MARKSYTTIAIPDELMSEVDSVVKSKKYGYKSRPELIKEAVRNLLLHLKKK